MTTVVPPTARPIGSTTGGRPRATVLRRRGTARRSGRSAGGAEFARPSSAAPPQTTTASPRAGEGAGRHRAAGARPDDDRVGGRAARPLRGRSAVQRRVRAGQAARGRRRGQQLRPGRQQQRDLHQLGDPGGGRPGGDPGAERVAGVGVEAVQGVPGGDPRQHVEGSRAGAQAEPRRGGQRLRDGLGAGGDAAEVRGVLDAEQGRDRPGHGAHRRPTSACPVPSSRHSRSVSQPRPARRASAMRTSARSELWQTAGAPSGSA